jgi:hypothetical protein
LYERVSAPALSIIILVFNGLNFVACLNFSILLKLIPDVFPLTLPLLQHTVKIIVNNQVYMTGYIKEDSDPVFREAIDIGGDVSPKDKVRFV